MLLTRNIALARDPEPEPPRADVRRLTVASYSAGFTLWVYRHDGDIAETQGPEFWAWCGFRDPTAHDGGGMFTAGDVIAVRTPGGTGMRQVVAERGVPVLRPVL